MFSSSKYIENTVLLLANKNLFILIFESQEETDFLNYVVKILY